MCHDECRVIGELASFGVRVSTCGGGGGGGRSCTPGKEEAPAGMDFHDDKAERTLTRCQRRVR